eukprot:TRINITY_DN8587_c0_g1_i10.p1 TRINITY_DN8587_c0_g1~~TRINITY_DN8587_c0_g1_i10.p1  ORF type:complete len:742 (-),score=159.22 TRINITY_DN8587_c0_g1_i10:364-2589(-)
MCIRDRYQRRVREASKLSMERWLLARPARSMVLLCAVLVLVRPGCASRLDTYSKAQFIKDLEEATLDDAQDSPDLGEGKPGGKPQPSQPFVPCGMPSQNQGFEWHLASIPPACRRLQSSNSSRMSMGDWLAVCTKAKVWQDVGLQFQLLDLVSVNDAKRQFVLDVRIEFRWYDPAVLDYDKIYAIGINYDDIMWNPFDSFRVLNSVEFEEVPTSHLGVEKYAQIDTETGLAIATRQRRYTLSNRAWSMKRFPFDSRTAQVEWFLGDRMRVPEQLLVLIPEKNDFDTASSTQRRLLSQADPTMDPTHAPTPTIAPTQVPSQSPTDSPTFEPTQVPSAAPTNTKAPTTDPTHAPTPTAEPTVSPTVSPTVTPTAEPTDTKAPTMDPTHAPTPTAEPTVSPTSEPTGTDAPTVAPTLAPTISPSTSPSMSPTMSPTISPSMSPTQSPTGTPTESPTELPTVAPSPEFSVDPGLRPVDCALHPAAYNLYLAPDPVFTESTVEKSSTHTKNVLRRSFSTPWAGFDLHPSTTTLFTASPTPAPACTTETCGTTDVHMSRIAAPIVLGYVLPMILCMTMAYFTWFLKVSGMMPRLALCIIAFLTGLTIMNTVSKMLPTRSNFCLLEWYFSYNFVLLGIMSLLHCVSSYWDANQYEMHSRLLDQTMRMCAPIIHVLSYPFAAALGFMNTPGAEVLAAFIAFAAVGITILVYLLLMRLEAKKKKRRPEASQEADEERPINESSKTWFQTK